MNDAVDILGGRARTNLQAERVGPDGSAGGVSLQVPVRRPGAAVDDVRGNTTIQVNDAGKLPATDQLIQEIRRILAEPFAAAKRKFRDVVAVELVANVEVGIGILL